MSTFLWTTYRGDDLPAPPATGVDPVTAIINSLLSDQAAATVIALAGGYVSTNFSNSITKYLHNPLRLLQQQLSTSSSLSLATRQHWPRTTDSLLSGLTILMMN